MRNHTLYQTFAMHSCTLCQSLTWHFFFFFFLLLPAAALLISCLYKALLLGILSIRNSHQTVASTYCWVSIPSTISARLEPVAESDANVRMADSCKGFISIISRNCNNKCIEIQQQSLCFCNVLCVSFFGKCIFTLTLSPDTVSMSWW